MNKIVVDIKVNNISAVQCSAMSVQWQEGVPLCQERVLWYREGVPRCR